jgi:hypothetical protein
MQLASKWNGIRIPSHKGMALCKGDLLFIWRSTWLCGDVAVTNRKQTMNTAVKTSKNTAAAPASAPAADTIKTASSFWTQLASVATPIAKLTGNQAQQDPKLAARTRFEKSVQEQVKLVKAAADKSRWFKKLPDGSYELTVRNGNTAMALGGNSFFQAKDAAAAVAFYEAVIGGVKAGELDEQLAATKRKPRTKKAGAPAAQK